MNTKYGAFLLAFVMWLPLPLQAAQAPDDIIRDTVEQLIDEITANREALGRRISSACTPWWMKPWSLISMFRESPDWCLPDTGDLLPIRNVSVLPRNSKVS